MFAYLCAAGQVTKASQTEPTRRHNGGGGSGATVESRRHNGVGSAATGESRRNFAANLEPVSVRRPSTAATSHEAAGGALRTNSNLEAARRMGGSIRSLEGKTKVREGSTENMTVREVTSKKLIF